MSLVEAVILGFIQGLTEFFPISSSGHLVITQALFKIKEPQLAFDIFLHLGTLASVLVYFRRDIIDIVFKERRTAVMIIAASIPTLMMGLMFKDAVEELFIRPRLVGYAMFATGILLVATNIYIRRTAGRKFSKPGLLGSLLIGTAQGVAIMPGISRSGATICAGILTGLDKEFACKFSFLLSVPAIIGASIIKCGDIGSALSSTDLPAFVVGGITAMIVGLLSIKVLLGAVRKGGLFLFGIYCMVAALFIMGIL